MPFPTGRVSRAAGRPNNEDACGDAWVGDSGCWVVADGLGGHRGGETASALAVQATLASFQSRPELSPAALQQHLEAAQQAVLKVQQEQPSLAGMRTTIVVLLTDSRQALWAHVGDSRLYCFDAGQASACTLDHSVVQAMVAAGEISPRDIRHHPDRNRLLRAVGNPDGDFRPEIAPRPRTLYKRGAFLLCTDGFWENVLESEMEVDFAKARDPDDWLGRLETRVLERTTGDSDNYTAVAVFVDSASAPAAPGPRFMEDRAMNGLSRSGFGTTAAVAGVALVALTAVGVWDGLLLRQVKEATDGARQAVNQSKAQQAVVPVLDPALLKSEFAKLDALCANPKFKAACAGTQSQASLSDDPASDASAAETTSRASTQKPKKSKKAKKQKTSQG